MALQIRSQHVKGRLSTIQGIDKDSMSWKALGVILLYGLRIMSTNKIEWV